MVKNALLPYKHVLSNVNYVSVNVTEVVLSESKHIYKRIMELKLRDIHCMSTTVQAFCNTEHVTANEVFLEKLLNEKENKLREFNFKILHNILPCNSKLFIWKKINNDKCDVCDEKQTVEHLLYECKYTKPLWSWFEEKCNINITYSKIICGIANNSKANRLITLLTFFIYKEWLLLSLDGKKRSKTIRLSYFLNELYLRYLIYERSKLYKIAEYIQHLISM